MPANNFKDLSGLVFGSWSVTNRYETRIRKNGKRASYWFCRCLCGLEKFVIGGQLVNGSSTKCKKCGSRKLPFGESARRAALSRYKTEALERNLSWNLSETEFDKLTKQDCFYCGTNPANKLALPDGSSFVYSGIDRADNTKGYEADNVVPCCRVCNRAKDVMSQKEFLDWIHRVAKRNQ